MNHRREYRSPPENSRGGHKGSHPAATVQKPQGADATRPQALDTKNHQGGGPLHFRVKAGRPPHHQLALPERRSPRPQPPAPTLAPNDPRPHLEREPQTKEGYTLSK
ncbi:hypothetical protein CRENBAI_001821 [Crenichthys baileyi]|uniref:Uncharacterized protein n=1 Tax=Crenichthys baileyi TaxID=28760 RepID=A0AAV9RVK2_9TELE